MTKKKDEAGTSAAGTQDTKKSADDNQAPETSAIETVADLEVCYPALVSEIRDDVIKSIEQCPVKEVKANLPMLYERIVTKVQGKSGPIQNVPGFLLEIDDPVAEGTLRTFQQLKGIDGLRLPHVLPYKDKVTKVALESYILRAEGCGDTKRADVARKAMEKCK